LANGEVWLASRAALTLRFDSGNYCISGKTKK
jgi:hypothetical protein